MSLMPCKECGQEISDDAKICPHCGAKENKSTWWIWMLAGLGAFFIFGVSNSTSTSATAPKQTKLRVAISECWKEQKKESLTPDEKRFIAGACEMLEKDVARLK